LKEGNMCDKKKKHILVRFSDGMLSIQDTIAEHQKIIENNGMVWFGKLGKSLGDFHISDVNKQIEEGSKSYLFLVQKNGKRYEFSKGEIIIISKSLPKKEINLVPPYYEKQGIINNINLWIKLSNIKEAKLEEIDKYHIVSSGSAVISSIRKSMAALFVLGEGKGIDFL